jgi:hypothetical protein
MSDFWTRTREGNKWAATATITVLAPENPKQSNSKCRERFDLYRTGMTIEEAYRAGILVGDLDSDLKHKFISVQ